MYGCSILSIKHIQMKNRILFCAFMCITSMFAVAQQTKTLHEFTVNDIDGHRFDMAQLKGKKVLIVNTASKCGYTPQYKELEELYQRYKSSNFIIIGFPANNFLWQEPGSNEEIKSFCSLKYNVTFPMMEKISVKGKDTAPLYNWLQEKAMNGVADAKVTWNFNKFLIDEQGRWVKHLVSDVSPLSQEITSWIEAK